MDLLPFLSHNFSTISPNTEFYGEIGKTQPENLRFKHDYCVYRFNRKKEKTLKIGVFGLDFGR